MSEELLTDEERRVIDLRTAVTAQMSETNRFILFGTLGWLYSLYVSDTKFLRDFVTEWNSFVVFATLAATLGIALDLAHYFSSYSSIKHTLAKRGPAFTFDRSRFDYRLASGLFVAKHIVVGVVLLITVIPFGLYVFTN